jgi:pimeloyl-ACP methyl ester carboxylesterase
VLVAAAGGDDVGRVQAVSPLGRSRQPRSTWPGSFKSAPELVAAAVRQVIIATRRDTALRGASWVADQLRRLLRTAEIAPPYVLVGYSAGGCWAADHLHELLRSAGIGPPYVLVGCSIGGWIADQFAAAWPSEVAGLVQIDPTFITPIPRIEWNGTFEDADGGLTFSEPACRAELEANMPSPPQRAVAISKAFGTVPLDVIERVWQPLTPFEVDHGWRACQVEWARRLQAVHIAATTAGHHVQIDQPALVAFAIRQVLAATQAGTDLALDPSDVAAAGGTLLP